MNIPIEHGKIYHIYNRGNNSEQIFRTKDDYRHFLKLYKIYVTPIAETYAWCLMRNHFHLCLRIKEPEEIGFLSSNNSKKTKELKWKVFSNPIDGINKKPKPVSQFRFLFNAYSKHFNAKHHRSGSLFEKNFERKLVEDENHLTLLIIYINNNPIKHLHMNNPEEYPWSSFNEIINRSADICDLKHIWHIFDNEENFRFAHDVRKDEENNWDDYFA